MWVEGRSVDHTSGRLSIPGGYISGLHKFFMNLKGRGARNFLKLHFQFPIP
nr:MAG TPA: hypothetical protein [Caudoviricetes sp.]